MSYSSTPMRAARPVPSRSGAGGEPAGVSPDAPATGHRRLPLMVLTPVLLLVLAVAMALGASVGDVGVGPLAAARVVGHHVAGFVVPAHFDAVQDQIVWQLRMPRVLLGAVVGAGLAAVGTTLQAVVRNPLADPYLLGVSSGAGFAVAATITLGSAALAGLSTSSAGFLGGLITTVLVLAIGRRGGTFSPTRVVLAGVTFSYLFSGATSCFIFMSNVPNAARAVLFWSLGSLSRAQWSTLGLPAAAVLLGTLYLLVQARPLDALVIGDETALSVGVNVGRVRAQLLVATALITGVMVAVAGGIGFVGLIIPHIVRQVLGPGHRRVLPAAAVVGAIYLVAVDIVCRVAASPAELPIGIITSVLGAPYFLWLLHRAHSAEIGQ
ncbi:FecCD family ABC transporter permease [Mycobacterium malmoense]|uniref:FecCD family ABC transporter permease n=1 Tax=Mycobacterium malmoense TaxID=1780 RepID=UPI000AE69116|nr:iron ABC transporter permease [Mycobacterium malmoense]